MNKVAGAAPLLVLTLSAACGLVIPGDPCGADGVYRGNIVLLDDVYYDAQSERAFARVGDGVVQKCREVRGDIILAGKISHLNDFNNVQSANTILVDEADLPDQVFEGTGPNGEDVDCGIVGPFESLVTLQETVDIYHGQQGCHVLAGFEKLEHVGGNFECGPNPEVGRALKHIGGTAICNSVNDRLANLEYAGEIVGHNYLPNLKYAGALRLEGNSDASVVTVPSLEEVGPIPHWDCLFCEEGLQISGNQSVGQIILPNLRHVEGDLYINGNRGTFVQEEGYETMSGLMRDVLVDTTVSGRRGICGNTSVDFRSDPCPADDDCISVHGENSVNCCRLETWDQCVETYGD